MFSQAVGPDKVSCDRGRHFFCWASCIPNVLKSLSYKHLVRPITSSRFPVVI